MKTNTKQITMKTLFRAAAIIAVLTVPLVVSLPDHARADNDNRASVHPAVGSWFGKAVQLTGGVTPGLALFMTPTIGADGTFLGNDSLALGAPPFGPHTTAHGSWAQSGRDSIVADYVFMLP